LGGNGPFPLFSFHKESLPFEELLLRCGGRFPPAGDSTDPFLHFFVLCSMKYPFFSKSFMPCLSFFPLWRRPMTFLSFFFFSPFSHGPLPFFNPSPRRRDPTAQNFLPPFPCEGASLFFSPFFFFFGAIFPYLADLDQTSFLSSENSPFFFFFCEPKRLFPSPCREL